MCWRAKLQTVIGDKKFSYQFGAVTVSFRTCTSTSYYLDTPNYCALLLLSTNKAFVRITWHFTCLWCVQLLFFTFPPFAFRSKMFTVQCSQTAMAWMIMMHRNNRRIHYNYCQWCCFAGWCVNWPIHHIFHAQCFRSRFHVFFRLRIARCSWKTSIHECIAGRRHSR